MALGGALRKQLDELSEDSVRVLALNHPEFVAGKKLTLTADLKTEKCHDPIRAIKSGPLEGMVYVYEVEDEHGEPWNIKTASRKVWDALDEAGVDVGDMFILKIEQLASGIRNYFVEKI